MKYLKENLLKKKFNVQLNNIKKNIDVVIGLGGGKALDTGKAVAFELKASVIDFASTASMDAPTAAVSVIYNEDGSFSGYEFYPKTLIQLSQILKLLHKHLYVYLHQV